MNNEEFLVSVAGDTIKVKLKKNGTWKMSKVEHVQSFKNFKQLQSYLDTLLLQKKIFDKYGYNPAANVE